MQNVREFNDSPHLISPLRYPGGKGAFSPYIAEVISRNGYSSASYFEPFAGGSGVALSLISQGLVENATLNDADYHIYCFWRAALHENQNFIDEIATVELSIAEWKR